jgi:hypothetical protein
MTKAKTKAKPAAPKRMTKQDAINQMHNATEALKVHQAAWDRKWKNAPNPFIAWQEYKAAAPERAAAYVPYFAAKEDLAQAHGSRKKPTYDTL